MNNNKDCVAITLKPGKIVVYNSLNHYNSISQSFNCECGAKEHYTIDDLSQLNKLLKIN